jgi:phage antirepressor YoqD-like protein
LISSDNTYTTSYIAHELGTSGRKLNELLNKFGIIYKHNDRWMLYSHYVDKGYHKALTNIEVSPGAKVSIAVYVAWTEKGRIFIHSTINKKLILYPGLLDSKK